MEEIKNKPLVASLFIFAMFSQLLLFSVTYTNASFQGPETPMRDYLAPGQMISPVFEQNLNIIADNLKWSFVTAFQVAKQPVLAFLGVSEYHFGQPRYTSIHPMLGAASSNAPHVLGAYISSE